MTDNQQSIKDDGIGYYEPSTAFKRGHAVGWVSSLAIMFPVYMFLIIISDMQWWGVVGIVGWLAIWYFFPTFAYKKIIWVAYQLHPDDGTQDEAEW